MFVRQLSFLMVFLLLAWQAASAQNVFRVRIDTMTVKAGDTATVNVYYSFTASKPHNLNGFVARFLFDSNLVKITGYITSGTASDGLMTTESHQGLAALGTSEINLSNPILFKMRVTASRSLSDTGWLFWDRDWPMFASEAGVDSVIQQDGWVKTPTVAAHTILHAPARSVHGVFTGPYADSVLFDLPITISDITAANVTRARLSFVYDRNRLVVQAVRSKLAATVSLTILPDVHWSFDTVQVDLQSSDRIAGNDTLVVLDFVALIGPDTVCTALTNVTWRPLNSDAMLGTTDIDFDSVCPIHLFGQYVPAAVETIGVEVASGIYPNPARDLLRVSGSDEAEFDVYDLLGRFIAQAKGVWTIPPSIPSGAYRVIVRTKEGHVLSHKLAIKR